MWVLSTAMLGPEPPWVLVVLHSLSPGFSGIMATVLAYAIDDSMWLPPVGHAFFDLPGA
jgi:hypothetical protein